PELEHYHYPERVTQLIISDIGAAVAVREYAAAPPVEIAPENICVIIYTSGTT
ncbi:MAG TPA: long-chain fatty acid--CoA ligase, partial [Firmicutes bacterium]|nr:long-chain fatty acid--CoA ligase [Bacillota bacterium]